MDVLKLLEDVKNDKVSLEEAAKELKQLPYEDLGFAKLDHHRQIRSGFGEVVFCSGKSDEHLLKIYETFYKTDTEVLGTRASEHQYELVKAVIPEVTYDPLSRILKIEKPGKEKIGRVAVCTAGTADIAVAEEAAQVAEYFGTNVDRFYDVGVAGIHRLFAKLEEIRKANCIIAVAGMEGARRSFSRTGGSACYCGSDIRWLWCELRRSVSTSDYAEFMFQRDYCCQH